jgi:hypothetical protein
MSTARRFLQTNLQISQGNAVTNPVQVPNGSTNLTVQIVYSGLDADVSLTLLQSLDGGNFDTCVNENDEPLTFILDKDFSSMTINISDLLTSWIKFSLNVGDATAGLLEKIYILMN